MKRGEGGLPLVPALLVATVAGLFIAAFGFVVPAPGFFVTFLLAVLVLVLVAWCNCCFRFQFIPFLLLCLVFFLLANIRYPGLLLFPEDVTKIDQLARGTTAVGVVTDLRQLSDGRSRIDVLISEVFDKGNPVSPARPLRMRLSVEEGSTAILPGDQIRFSGRLRRPRLFGTPGEFHWPRYLAGQGVEMTSWVRSTEQIEVMAAGQNVPNRQIVRWRTQVAAAITATLPAGQAPLVRALVLGEGQQLPDEVRLLLAGAGVSHLFAISGLHLGLLGLFGYQLLLVFYRRSIILLSWQPPQRILPLLLLPLLFGYLLFTGDAVSTRRAFALACIGVVLLLWRYPVNPLHLLASVALASLLMNPLLLWQAGWQLSFSGAAGILLWRPLWQSNLLKASLFRPLRYPLQVFLVTGAATLATLPWVLFNFHLIAPAGLLANLVCVPVVTLVALPLGFIGLMLFPICLPSATLLFRLCGFCLEQLLHFSAWVTDLPGLSGHFFFLSRSQYLAVALIILPLLLVPQLRRRIMVTCTLISFCTALLMWQLPSLSSVAPVTLTMLSVGQGESLLLQNQSGQNILVDGGGLYSRRFDVGERLLAPAFGELGVRHLDMVVLTHNHADHWKGLVFILDRYPVGEFVIGRPLSAYHPDLREVVERRKIPVRVVEDGWTSLDHWTLGSLSVFSGTSMAVNANDASLVLYLGHFAEHGLLLTGDIEEAGGAALIKAGIPGPVTLLKVPHHGSRKSNTAQLLTLLRPEVGLISVGYQNSHRLPAREILAALAEHQVAVFRTDMDASIRARFIDSGWQVQRWHDGLFR